MNPLAVASGLAAAAVAGAQLAPALVGSVGPLRRRLAPGLAGTSPLPHVGLTYDDGPDPASTPAFLALLAEHRTRATFFLLASYAAAHPSLTREIVAEGHEVGLHGWDHRCVAAKRPGALAEELARSSDVLGDLVGARVAWYRPPYGVLTTEALLTARRLGLHTVLWTAWGRDWERRATPSRIVRTVGRTLAPGGTVLLHDTDRTSAPDSWRSTLAASRVLLDRWDDDGTVVGPLREHWPASGSHHRRPEMIGSEATER